MICHHTIHKHFLLHYPYPALVSPLRDLGGFGVRSKRLVHRVITQYLSNQASVGAANWKVLLSKCTRTWGII